MLFCGPTRGRAAVQGCPVVPNPPQIAPSTAKSRLASSITIMTFLPPISRQTCLNVSAQAFETWRPTSVEPVKDTTRTSECVIKAWPTSPPPPATKFTTPRGTPASSRTFTRLYIESGVSVAGFITTVFPQISAGITFQDGIAMGKFQGVMSEQTPMGLRTDMQNLLGSSEGVV